MKNQTNPGGASIGPAKGWAEGGRTPSSTDRQATTETDGERPQARRC